MIPKSEASWDRVEFALAVFVIGLGIGVLVSYGLGARAMIAPLEAARTAPMVGIGVLAAVLLTLRRRRA